jgi:hypothetical protein
MEKILLTTQIEGNKLLSEIDPNLSSEIVEHEQMTFYTIKKDDYTFYMQHFFDEPIEGEDYIEATLTVFKNKEKLPSWSGTFLDTVKIINKLLNGTIQ